MSRSRPPPESSAPTSSRARRRRGAASGSSTLARSSRSRCFSGPGRSSAPIQAVSRLTSKAPPICVGRCRRCRRPALPRAANAPGRDCSKAWCASDCHHRALHLPELLGIDLDEAEAYVRLAGAVALDEALEALVEHDRLVRRDEAARGDPRRTRPGRERDGVRQVQLRLDASSVRPRTQLRATSVYGSCSRHDPGRTRLPLSGLSTPRGRRSAKTCPGRQARLVRRGPVVDAHRLLRHEHGAARSGCAPCVESIVARRSSASLWPASTSRKRPPPRGGSARRPPR